jgi:hypothetical protein
MMLGYANPVGPDGPAWLAESIPAAFHLPLVISAALIFTMSLGGRN